jgi:hypothetical protein
VPPFASTTHVGLIQVLGTGMSSIAFDAMVVSSHDPEEGLFLIGFADDPTNPSQYLLLQRSLEPTDQDRDLGQDTYYLEWCSQEQSVYGGIDDFSLSDSNARIRFAPQATNALGGLSELVISFSLSQNELEALDQGLQVVFSGSRCFSRANA